MKKILDKYAYEVAALNSLNPFRTNQLATDAAAEINEQIEMNEQKKTGSKPSTSTSTAKTRLASQKNGNQEENDMFEDGDEDLDSNPEKCEDMMGQFE